MTERPTPKLPYGIERKAETKHDTSASGEDSFDLEFDEKPKPPAEHRLETAPPDSSIEGEVERYIKENPAKKKTILNPNALMSALLEAKRRENKDK